VLDDSNKRGLILVQALKKRLILRGAKFNKRGLILAGAKFNKEG
jgi:hypothetical protein